MTKVEINNEIVLLRHTVRQARICIVNKLVKEAKLLRNKHGNEVQREKYKRKADKLIAEVYALKGIKDDEISKFGITNERNLTAILQESSSDYDRAIAKVAHFKILDNRLKQFKEKFPDYKKYLVEGKKNVKLKNKSVAKTKKSLKENPQPQTESSEEQKINTCKNIEYSQYKPKNEKLCNTELLETTNNLHECKKSSNEDSALLKEEKMSRLEDDTLEDTVIHKQPSVIKSCNVTKEATVKKFSELLEEQESSENMEISIKVPDSTTQQAKILDNFFITGDNQDFQTSSISVSTSYVKSHKHDTQTFQSSNRVERQNINYRNNTNFHKTYRDKQPIKSVKRLNNKTSIKINKDSNKNNSNNINNKEDNNLHPSWLAKKKEQQIMSQKFQGKKIVFADD